MNSWQLTTPQFDATEGNSNLGVMLFPTAQLRPIRCQDEPVQHFSAVHPVPRPMIALVPLEQHSRSPSDKRLNVLLIAPIRYTMAIVFLLDGFE